MKKLTIGLVSFVFLIGLLYVASSGSSTASTSRLLSGADFLSTYQATAGAVLLDVRTPGEFSAGHLEGATNVDFENSSFMSELQKLDKTKPYFLYCRSGNRSGQVRTIMKREGFENIYDLQGGIVGNQNLTLTTGAQ